MYGSQVTLIKERRGDGDRVGAGLNFQEHGVKENTTGS